MRPRVLNHITPRGTTQAGVRSMIVDRDCGAAAQPDRGQSRVMENKPLFTPLALVISVSVSVIGD